MLPAAEASTFMPRVSVGMACTRRFQGVSYWAAVQVLSTQGMAALQIPTCASSRQHHVQLLASAAAAAAARQQEIIRPVNADLIAIVCRVRLHQNLSYSLQ